MASTTENSANKLLDFYIDQYEQFAPKWKQGVEDWFDLSEKVVNQFIKVQESFIDKVSSTKSETTKISEQSRSITQSLINLQKELYLSSIDIISKNIQSFKHDSGKKVQKHAPRKRSNKKPSSV